MADNTNQGTRPFLSVNANTGPVTFQEQGQCVTSLTWSDGSAVKAGELEAHEHVVFDRVTGIVYKPKRSGASPRA